MTFAVPPSEYCISSFHALRNRLKPPLRVTVRGRVADLLPEEVSKGGNKKRMFNIVDAAGLYITCCALKHNTANRALQNHREVVLYFCTGRCAMGDSRGMLFLMKDAMVVPLDETSLVEPTKTEELIWNVTKPKDMQEHRRERQRVSITREHVRQMGVTVGCRGCRAVIQGLRAENHSEVCRRRFEANMRATGDPKLSRAEQRLKINCTA